MPRKARFVVVLAVACAALPFAPLFIQRTMVRSQHGGRVGDLITYGFSLRTLSGIVSDLRYMRPEQHPGLVLAANGVLLLIYAAGAALVADRALEHRRR